MEGSRNTAELISRSLGDAVVGMWGSLPHDVQHQLFKSVIKRHGESLRWPLAVHLHDRHPRTCDAMRARAVIEPDSLGG